MHALQRPRPYTLHWSSPGILLLLLIKICQLLFCRALGDSAIDPSGGGAIYVDGNGATLAQLIGCYFGYNSADSVDGVEADGGAFNVNGGAAVMVNNI